MVDRLESVHVVAGRIRLQRLGIVPTTKVLLLLLLLCNREDDDYIMLIKVILPPCWLLLVVVGAVESSQRSHEHLPSDLPSVSVVGPPVRQLVNE